MASRASRVTLLALFTVGWAGGAAAQTSSPAEQRTVDRAERLYRSGRTSEAWDLLVGLLQTSPASAAGLTALFEISLERGDPDAFLPFGEAAMAAAGEDPTILDLEVRALVESGRLQQAREAAERWRRLRPEDPAGALALAGVHMARGDTGAAISVLDRAARGASASRALDLRRGELFVATGDEKRAVGVWSRLLAGETPAVADVVGQILSSGPDAGAFLEALAMELEGAPPELRRQGSRVALRAGRPEVARDLALSTLDADNPAGFLREYAREADGGGLPGEVAWAAAELGRRSSRPADRLRWMSLAADRGLLAGDSSAALEALGAIARSTPAGDRTHEAATRTMFDLLVADTGALAEAETLFAEYSATHPDSVVARAGMYAGLALAHARAGAIERGETLLARGRDEMGGDPEVDGVLDAAGAWLALYAGRRDSALARATRSVEQPALAPAERTERLGLLSWIRAGDSLEVAVAGRAAHALLRDPRGFDPAPPLRILAGAAPSSGRSVVLMGLAEVAAAAGRRDVAEGLWRGVVEAYADRPEAPAALLALARGATPESARGWLERLVVEYPESALAPTARRLLAELADGGRP